jgi:catechol 2,3-dioxygenase-like lactoylglutathione lyase family enzyme
MNPVDNAVFDNIALSVTDLERSMIWYTEVLGFTPGYRTYRSPDAEVVPGPHLRTSGFKALVLRTDDLEDVTRRLEDHGVEFVWKNRVLSDDGLRSTMLRDPDKNLINVLRYPDR